MRRDDSTNEGSRKRKADGLEGESRAVPKPAGPRPPTSAPVGAPSSSATPPSSNVKFHESHGVRFSSTYDPIQRLTSQALVKFKLTFRGSSSSIEVWEVQHPLFPNVYVLPPVAGFSCDTLLADASQSFENVDWTQVYQALTERARGDLIQTRERVQRPCSEDPEEKTAHATRMQLVVVGGLATCSGSSSQN